MQLVRGRVYNFIYLLSNLNEDNKYKDPIITPYLNDRLLTSISGRWQTKKKKKIIIVSTNVDLRVINWIEEIKYSILSYKPKSLGTFTKKKHNIIMDWNINNILYFFSSKLSF